MFAEVEMLHDVAQCHPFGHSGWQYWKLLAVEMALVSAYKIQNICTAYGMISHMTTVCRTITREHQRCCYQQVRSKKHFVHPTFPLLIIQSMAARKPTT